MGKDVQKINLSHLKFRVFPLATQKRVLIKPLYMFLKGKYFIGNGGLEEKSAPSCLV